MNYLLVGNAPTDPNIVRQAGLKADVIIEANLCLYASVLTKNTNRFIFVTNTGENYDSCFIRKITHTLNYPQYRKAQILLARNPLFYRYKQKRLEYNDSPLSPYYTVQSYQQNFRKVIVTKTIGFLETYFLERHLIAQGMPPHFMPSTGMVAFNWIQKRLTVGDSLALTGFEFKGWEYHPWNVERKIIHSINATRTGEAA